MRTQSLNRKVGAFFLPASVHRTLAAAGQYVGLPGKIRNANAKPLTNVGGLALALNMPEASFTTTIILCLPGFGLLYEAMCVSFAMYERLVYDLRLFHVSEESDIQVFYPRLPKRKDLDPSTGLVWAIDEEQCLIF